MRETLRAWQEQFETFALEVIFNERRGKRATALRGVLFCLSKVFLIGVKGRRWLYEARIIRDHPLGVQVITVGNLSAYTSIGQCFIFIYSPFLVCLGLINNY